MADVQRYFEQFHDTIRTDYEMNRTLREKKDIIVTLLRRRFQEEDRPAFQELLQGSYSQPVRTGVCPIAGLEFDIDVGLRFGFSANDYEASDVRKWVLKAVEGHTNRVEDKGPCIRVGYADGFHVDLVPYAVWNAGGVEQFRLAHRTKGWRPADPPALLKHIKRARELFADTEDSRTNTDQLRRITRYLKRWYDEAIPVESDAKPSGLAFLLLAIDHLQPTKSWDGRPDDRKALWQVANYSSIILRRLTAFKPTPEYEDMFSSLSDKHMGDLKSCFQSLGNALTYAELEVDPVKACQRLQDVLGADFPVPEPERTAKRTSAPAIVTSSSSA
ncbi:MAG: nucleotidyltransferase [Acidobacteria bacterium]|nr:nucleotidyltransferase [Acidobacteriota bacterium]